MTAAAEPGGLGGRAEVHGGQGVQVGTGNEQRNFFAPITNNLFVAGFERLRDVCFDPTVLERDLDLARFIGREWLIKRIDEFIATRSRGYIIVLAEAGVGKSSLAAHLVGERPWLHHFTRLPGGRSPEAARKSLAAQLISRWRLTEWAPGGFLPDSAERPDWFDRLLHAAARQRDRHESNQPIVLVIDGLDEAEATTMTETGLPLGLPPSLPDGVFVVATSRFGIDRALHAVRNPADWQQIEVEGEDNLQDMHQFISEITGHHRGDPRLSQLLDASGVDLGWFRRTLAERCAEVWIYLRYVLDEIRSNGFDPSQIDRLPGDLAGYYAEQIERWGADPASSVGQDRWEQVWLPLLGILAAARAPFTLAELITFAGVTGEEPARLFIEETTRAFLNRREGRDKPTRYSLRHQSFRDLLNGVIPEGRPDLRGLAETFVTQSRIANRKIAKTLIPAGMVGDRDWRGVNQYTRDYLAVHAAACGLLDDLLNDPGFLVIARPDGVVANRRSLHSEEGKLAALAFELSLPRWTNLNKTERLQDLALSAAKVRATRLAFACTILMRTEWPIKWAAWSGQVSWTLAGHRNWVNSVAVGPAGDRDVIVSASDDSTIRAWDATTRELTCELSAIPSRAMSSVAIGRAGGRDVIVAGSYSANLTAWDAITGELIRDVLDAHQQAVTSVAIGQASGRDVIVSGSEDGTVRVWDATTCEPIEDALEGHYGAVTSVAIGRSGERDVIVSGSEDGTLCLWDATTRELIGDALESEYYYYHGNSAVTSVAIGRSGERDVIVSGSEDGTVLVWDATTGEVIGSLLESEYYYSHGNSAVTSVAIGRSGERDVIVSGSEDGTVLVWDATSGEVIGDALIGHEGAVTSVTIGQVAGRELIVSGSRDRTVKIWDTSTSELTGGRLAGHQGAVSSVALGRAGDLDVIVSGSEDHTVRIWDAATGDPIGAALVGHDDPVTSVAIGLAGDEHIIVSGSYDETVRIWDAVTGEAIEVLYSDGIVSSVGIGRFGGREVITASLSDGAIILWDAVTREVMDRLLDESEEWRHESCHAIAIGRRGDNEIIAAGYEDGFVLMWVAGTKGATSQELHGEGEWVNAVTIGQIGTTDVILSASDDGSVRVWDTATCTSLTAPPATRGAMTAVAIGRVGEYDMIVSGTYDGTVNVWDGATGQSICPPFIDHEASITSVAIGCIGNRHVIVSGSEDNTLVVRDRQL